MKQDHQPISGWKAIGAHFGRDRTTSIRWANERGLPVHRVPGGKTATVFALKGELDAWLTGQGSSDAVLPAVRRQFEIGRRAAGACLPPG